MTELGFKSPQFEPGHVWLVGAGPGDPGLLTLHAVNALKQAEVIVYDALVSEDILSYAKDDVELIYAGKRGGKPSPLQADISLRLIQLARQEKRVLRLKGGDPFIFGRGGEEALSLVAAGVPFRVVPGVTAGIGGLAYAGIPATHRDVNHAVTFVTGHDASGDIHAMDWHAIANGAPVIVLYMAVKHIQRISDELIQHGRHGDDPVAVVSKACTPEQVVLETNLKSCAEDVKSSGIEPPAIIVVGDVVRLRDGLDWMGALDGKVLEADPLNVKSRSDLG